MKYIKRFGEGIFEAKKKSKGKDYSNEPWFAKYQEEQKRRNTYPYVDEDLIIEECKAYNLNISKIHPDGTVDIDGDVDLSRVTYMYRFRLKFGVVKGDFNCTKTNLTSLVGAPSEVIGDFLCSDNKLTNLIGSPKKVGGNFNCSGNSLTSLEGGPTQVSDGYFCSTNHIKNLKGAPLKMVGGFFCGNCSLTSLEGGPEEVGIFNCNYNKLTNLNGAPRYVRGDFDCGFNKLTDLKGGPDWVAGKFSCSHNKLQNLKGIPSFCASVECISNDLLSLEGCPESLEWLYCSNNPNLTSLEGGPLEVSVGYIASECTKLYKMGKMIAIPRHHFNFQNTVLNNLISSFARSENMYKDFFDSLDYNYITTTENGEPAIIEWRFREALSEFDLIPPNKVNGYVYV